jgi:hypothetical protein
MERERERKDELLMEEKTVHLMEREPHFDGKREEEKTTQC